MGYAIWDLSEEVHVTSKPFSRACLILSLTLVAAGYGGPSRPALPAPDCNDEQIRDVLQLASRDEAEIVVKCSLTVPRNFVIT